MKSAPARLREYPETGTSSAEEGADRRERYRKLAALIQAWEMDPAGHGKAFWPVLAAELDRHDD